MAEGTSLLFRCSLCKGYIIDATAIIPCLHTFCRSCVIIYAQHSNYCPDCGSFFKADKDYLKRDLQLQRLIYHMVPHLLQCEVKRREEFHTKNNLRRNVVDEDSILKLCLFLKEMSTSKETLLSRPIYLEFPACATIRILKKFLRFKLMLQGETEVYICHKNCNLSENESLKDVLHSFGLYDTETVFAMEYSISTKNNESIHSDEINANREACGKIPTRRSSRLRAIGTGHNWIESSDEDDEEILGASKTRCSTTENQIAGDFKSDSKQDDKAISSTDQKIITCESRVVLEDIGLSFLKVKLRRKVDSPTWVISSPPPLPDLVESTKKMTDAPSTNYITKPMTDNSTGLRIVKVESLATNLSETMKTLDT